MIVNLAHFTCELGEALSGEAAKERFGGITTHRVSRFGLHS